MKKKATKTQAPERSFQPLKWLKRWGVRLCLLVFGLGLLTVTAHRFVAPPQGLYMRQEAARLGGIKQSWVSADAIAPVMFRSVVAAEDANFCAHWGFDMTAIRAALADGTGRGASTLTQQVVKNAYLWHGRNWSRKALEAVLTPLVELIWPKRRILEVYLNIAEFDEGVFGVKAAAQHYFGVTPAQLSPLQAARLAAILPAPKERSASKPSSFIRKRTARIRDGAETIRRDGRAACFES
ncbi:monofunctional biosynthetic peptidoglycan transglycosylase [uncultured Lentibacter sp.]|uniref:monofunctional biosynthetic peptidoglycan transglycosylase n=1 Tax=uncultured Lentibacter sp. TaxID=1659309 RepID=UPI0026135652|nr:monofunctional biosynthetic peptidoglycan transglycosylase [uncultured Lentibacter sp.]MCW1954390.1 monofunctional biosynthetic peptidoglycan transglycosylase [Roseobacter sp.]